MAGEIDDIAAQFKRQTALFEQLRTTAGELAKSNGQIVRAAESAGQVAHMATDDMANSRRTVEQSVKANRAMVDSATAFEKDLAGLKDALERVAKVAKGIDRDRQADQPARAQRHDRGGACGRGRARLRGGGGRGQDPRQADQRRDRGDSTRPCRRSASARAA